MVPNGVNPEVFNTQVNQREMKRKLAILEKDIVVGYVGSIFPWHGLENLIESANMCLKEVPNLKFLIVGDGKIRKELEEKAREYRIEEKVMFTGRVPQKEVPDYLQVMDICVYPGSKDFPERYGSPVKVFEYGTMGKAVISCRSKVTENIFDDLHDGYLIPPGSVEELSTSILELAKKSDLRKKLGSNFKKKVLKNYTWEKIGKKILEVIANEIEE